MSEVLSDSGVLADRGLLTQALAKVNALHDGSPGDFLPAELQALRAFVASRTASALTDRESDFYRRIEELLRVYPPVQSDLAEAERRKNALLRTAIDKCLLGSAAEVSLQERRILESTSAQLDAIADPSASHLRLRGLVGQAMAALSALETFAAPIPDAVAETAPTTSGPVRVSASPGAKEAATFFQGGTRTRMREFSEIPIDTNARVIEHDGDLEINGNVPDDVTLVVREGGVIVNGQCEGNVLASGGIEVRGNIAGPWTVSLDGGIRCERVLGGANLLAPHGEIHCTSLERPGKLYSGELIHVEKDARGGSLTAPAISVDGTMRGTETQVLNSLVCGTIVGDARENAQVTFRNMLSSEDYKVSMSEETLSLLRDATRFRFREAVGASIVEALRSDFCAVQCARLYVAATGKSGGLDLASLRTVQSKAAYIPVAITVGTMLEQVLLEALEFEGDAQAAALNTGTDECNAAVKFLEREAAYLSDDVTRETKAIIVSACKHLANLSKKIRENAGQRPVLEEAAQALMSRITEWRGLRTNAEQSLAEIQYDVRSAIGDSAALEREPARLGHAVGVALQSAGAVANSGPMRSLKVLAERYVVGLAHYVQGATEVSAERKRIEERLSHDPSVSLGGGRAAERYARAARFGPHVVLSTSPGLSVPHAGGPETEEGRNIRVDRELAGPATFVCDGLTLRRTML